jgi:hypothetical protein
MLYNALVHHSVIDSARARSPRFFIGMAPDVASGLQIATHSTHYTWTSFPLTTVQAPSRTPEWSNGLSCERGGSLARRFHDEFGNSPLRRYRMPLTGASIVFSTILDFRRIHPDVAGALPVGWDIYARIAAQQIEGMDPNDRLRLHSALLRATQREGIDPRAIGMQLRMWGVSRFPRLYRQTLALRRRFGLLRPPPRPPYGDRIRSREESLSAALRTLAREAGVESHGHDNRHSPAGWQASS